MEKLTVLQKIDILSGLDSDQLAALEAFAEVVSCKKGEKLFQVGQEARDIFFLLEGKMGVQVQLTSRPETVSIVVLGKFGQLVGWSGLIEGAYYTATGVCMEDTQLLVVDGKKFMALLEQNPESGFHVMRKISAVISERIRNLQSVVLKTM